MIKRLILVLVVVTLVSCSANSPKPAAGVSGLPNNTYRPDSTITPTPFFPADTLYPGYEYVKIVTPTPIYIPPTETPTPDLASIMPGLVTTPSELGPVDYQAPFPYVTDNDTITFLLLGSDIRSTGSFRTDVMIIVAFRPSLGQITLISIPRDLWVYIPTQGMQRINTAYLKGETTGYPGKGPGLVRDTILYNLGIRIDHVAMVDFNGFKKIIDTIGGVDVPVACQFTDWHLIDPSYDQQNENNWENYTIGPGIIHMDGELALWYARSRKQSSDFDRGRRQQEILRTVFTKMLQVSSITKLPELYDNFKETINTDISLSMILELAPFVFKLNSADIRSFYIRPPLVFSWTTSGGAYVLSPHTAELQAMLKEAMSPSTKIETVNPITIEIRNGTLNTGWDRLAMERLNYAGYQATIIPYDQNNLPNTFLFDLNTNIDEADQQFLTSLLGLSSSALILQPIADTAVNYSLVLGSDYNPCFKPELINP
jgi:LCP family protein required for cell wall assembly